MRSFIIRPFGSQSTKAGGKINFDAVARDLIDPALTAAGLTGRETIEIVAQGNIREDMFQRLLTADVVIADITIHNANVFYELGLRHALRGRVTFLLRGNTEGDVVPFDLKTDRYLGYDPQSPGDKLAALTEALQASIRSERPDSPVFQLLPNMVPQDPDAFLVLPRDFQETVRLCAAEQKIAELALMSLEVERMAPTWENPAHRLIGNALFDAKAFDRSHTAWERVRRTNPDDLQANLRLGTIYQRQGHLNKSETALERIVPKDKATLAEVEALRGSNAKQLWMDQWAGLDIGAARTKALESSFLEAARRHYETAYAADLNHTYSGINALALTRIICELATALPEIWAGLYASDEAATMALNALVEKARRIEAALALALEDSDDPWAAETQADLALLTTDRAPYVVRKFRDALRGKPDRTHQTVLRQLGIYTRLGLLEPIASEVTTAIQAMTGQEQTPQKPERFVIFTGHRVDAKDRDEPRFPNTPPAIAAATVAIKAAVQKEQALYPSASLTGVCGGANGADLIFQEVCDALGLDAWLLLAIPREAYIKASVSQGGRDWITRFEAIYDKRKTDGRLVVLQDHDDEALPSWLADMPDYGIWQRNNLWSLSFGFQKGAERASLLALWDRKKGDGMGGTKDMVAIVRQHGVPSTIIDMDEIVKAV